MRPHRGSSSHGVTSPARQSAGRPRPDPGRAVGHGGLVAPPGRQGPGSLSADAVEALDLAFARRAGGVLPGDHRGTGVGAGTELAQLRPYEPGDDVRQLDPAASARTLVAHVRQHVPERALTTWIVLDVSASMGFGTATRLKSDVAEGVAVVLARLAVRRGGRVAALACGGPVVRLLPPRGGRRALASVQRLAAEGVAPDGLGDDGGLADGLWRVRRLAREAGLVVVVSDFRARRLGAARCGRCAHRHSVLAVEVGDPREERAARRGPPRARRPGDRAPRRGRHDVGAAARPLRRGGGRAPRGAGHDAAPRGGRARAPEHRRRLAAGAGPPRAMSFGSPLGLLALLVVPVGAALYVAARHRRRRHALRFPAVATLAGVLPGVKPWRRRVPLALLALAAVALAVALAKPQRSVAVAVDNASVVLVMDASRSMLSQDVAPTRIDAARKAALSFVDKVPSGLQLGLVGYNTVPFLAEGPTLERDRVRSGIESLQADGGTATGDALAEALKRLQQRKDAQGRRAPAAIVLLSDGKSTDGRDPVEVARQAGRLGIPISTVALGTAEGVVPGGPFGAPLSVPPDPETLRQIAAASKGDAFQVGEAGQLNDVYRRLGSQLGTRREDREVTAAFAGAGLLLLLGAAALGTRWRARLG